MVTMIDVATFLGILLILQLMLFTLFYIVQAIRILINIVFPPNFVMKYGKWAVITGSSDGIGLAYARELAKRGMNVVLMSYAEEQLLEAAKQIETDFKVETKSIVVDFSEGRKLIYDKISSQIKDLDIGVLVNNVGVAIPYPMMVEEMTEKQIWDHVSVNILTGTMMTSSFLPDMKKRGRGAIINIASITALAPFPYLTVYSASKAYVDYFTRGLQVECKDSGVTIQSITPGFVNTNLVKNFSSFSAGGVTVPRASTFVKHAIKTLGVLDRTTGYLPHALQVLSAAGVPIWLFSHCAAHVSKFYRNEYEANKEKNKTE